MIIIIETEDGQREETFTLMDYDNLDFSKEEEIYHNNDIREAYNPTNIEIKVR